MGSVEAVDPRVCKVCESGLSISFFFFFFFLKKKGFYTPPISLLWGVIRIKHLFQVCHIFFYKFLQFLHQRRGARFTRRVGNMLAASYLGYRGYAQDNAFVLINSTLSYTRWLPYPMSSILICPRKYRPNTASSTLYANRHDIFIPQV
jgi:hypothetical protein